MTLAEATEQHRVTTIEQLESLYGTPSERALVKELDHISDHYRAFVEASPFVLVATCGPEGLDCSPRGDPPGFVRVLDAHTVLLPDRRGNNRLDTLKNLVRDPRISLLFLVPGVGETLRINGRAEIVADPDLCRQFEMQGKAPTAVLRITAERVYFQCQKALARSKLWDPATRVARSSLPSAGEILSTITDGGFDGAAYDKGYTDYMKQTIY